MMQILERCWLFICISMGKYQCLHVTLTKFQNQYPIKLFYTQLSYTVLMHLMALVILDIQLRHVGCANISRPASAPCVGSVVQGILRVPAGMCQV